MFDRDVLVATGVSVFSALNLLEDMEILPIDGNTCSVALGLGLTLGCR